MTEQELDTETRSVAQTEDGSRESLSEDSVHSTGDHHTGSASPTTSCGDALSWDKTLCLACRSFFDNLWEQIRLRSHGVTSRDPRDPYGNHLEDCRRSKVHKTRALPSCVALGCRLCAAAQQELAPTDSPFHWHEFLGAYDAFDPQRRSGPLIFELPSCSLKLELVTPGLGDSASYAIDLGDSTGSEGTMARIKTWLELCETHDLCRSRLTGDGRFARLPTRLIALSDFQGTVRCQLVETNNMADTIRYTTLSYRWGTADMLKCTRRNLDSLRRCIVWKDLPKTFQDAFTTTRQLGISHIWVDALCIVQDDPQDWSREASAMANVYSGSFLNLAAANSANAHEDLFRPRTRCKPLFSVPRSEGESTLLCYDRRELWHERELESSLSGRGWIVQELILATRIVHFRQNTIRWTCMELDRDEVQTLCVRTWDDELYRGSSRTSWWNIAGQYSATQTTKSSDRPMALAGVAEQECHRMGLEPSDYLSGLWRPRFVADLCWRSGRYEARTARRIETGDATPSWSSISMHTEHIHADTFPKGRDVVTQLIAAETVPTSGPFGPVSSAYARVAGPLCRCYLLAEPNEDGSVWKLMLDGYGVKPQVCEANMPSHVKLYVFPDSPAARTTCAMPSHKIRGAPPIYLLLCSRNVDSDDENAYLAWKSQNRRGFWDFLASFHLLILHPTDLPGHFTRLGVAWLVSNWQTEPWTPDIVDSLDGLFRGDYLDPDLYHEVDKDFMYTITLV